MKKIGQTTWSSNKEYFEFAAYMQEKCAELYARGWWVYWDEESNWVHIKKNQMKGDRLVLECCAKVFSEPSSFGINNGRISKLQIWEHSDYPNPTINHRTFYNYDRGLDTNDFKRNKLAKKLFDHMMEVYG
jgi:hypothetical protein